MQYAPIWSMVYIPIVLIAGANAALYFMAFVRPDWTKPRSYARLAIDGVWLLVLGILIGVGEYFVTASKLTRFPMV